MKIAELFEAKKPPAPAVSVLIGLKLKRIKVKYQAELDGESMWDLGEDLRLHIINAGRAAAIYFESPAPDDAHGHGAGSSRGWFLPVDRYDKAFVQRYPWLKNLIHKSSFKIENSDMDDFEEWVRLWLNRKQ